jgi:arsenate reductase
LMLAQPSLIKRPVLEADGRVLVGFTPSVYEPLFTAATRTAATHQGRVDEQ